MYAYHLDESEKREKSARKTLLATFVFCAGVSAYLGLSDFIWDIKIAGWVGILLILIVVYFATKMEMKSGESHGSEN